MPEEQPRILIVDDSPDGREMLAEYLTFRGFAVVAASSGEAALTLARTHRPSLILMDLQMPGVDGWEATRRLKADAATRDILVVAVTAHAMRPDEGKARAAGCDGFVAKPFDLTAVAGAVAEVLEHGRPGLVAFANIQQVGGVGRKSPRRRTSARKKSRFS